MKYTIDLSKVKDSDVSAMSLYPLGAQGQPSDYYKYEFNILGGGPENGMQYKFFNYLSSEVFNNKLLLDIGSRAGFSALALGLSKKNQVLAYDIIDYRQYWNFINNQLGYSNINFIIQDCQTISPVILNNSPFISLDIDPHDGDQEIVFFDLLRKNNYKGLVSLDDTNWEAMKKFINTIKEPIYDITKYAHGSGTMLVDFSYGENYTII